MKIVQYNPRTKSSFVRVNIDEDYMYEDLSESRVIITPIKACRPKPSSSCYQCAYGKPCSKHVSKPEPGDADEDWELAMPVTWNTQGFMIYWDENIKKVAVDGRQYKAVLQCASCSLFEFRIAVCNPRLVLS